MDCSKPPCSTPGLCCAKKKKQIKDCCPDKKGCPTTPFTSSADLNKENSVLYMDSIKDDEIDCYFMRKCKLVSYYEASKKDACCKAQTGHHIVPYSAIKDIPNCSSHSTALTICVSGNSNNTGVHGYIHNQLCKILSKVSGDKMSFSDLQDKGIQACKDVLGGDLCDWVCIKKELSKNHSKMSKTRGNKNSGCKKITASTQVDKSCGISTPGSLSEINNRMDGFVSSISG